MRAKTRNVFFALLGVAGLVLEGHYRGPYQQAVHSYGGNIAASFAVYYIVALLPLPPQIREAADRRPRTGGGRTLRGLEWLRRDDERIRSS
jgi:hypothetical protein